jgi:hypothetical protein
LLKNFNKMYFFARQYKYMLEAISGDPNYLMLSNEKIDAAIGCLLGTAVGDAIGSICLTARRGLQTPD